MHANDNVAIVANDGGLPAGTTFDDGLTLRDKLPQGHKVSLVDIAQGAPVRRYNVVIGTALRDIGPEMATALMRARLDGADFSLIGGSALLAGAIAWRRAARRALR